MQKLLEFVKVVLRKNNLNVIRSSAFDRLVENEGRLKKLSSTLIFMRHLTGGGLEKMIDHVENSKSQVNQDVFVLNTLDYKKGGFFVEFGAADGLSDSNTFLLEKKFNWEGILAEPARQWHEALNDNRRCNISTKCVWKISGEKLLFNEIVETGFSTIDVFSSEDHHFDARKNGCKYYVESISLHDLLESFNAPKEIDYLSIDTEGSEFDILSRFDFSKWNIKIITVEHNFTKSRNALFKLLNANGYERVLMHFSEFDDWYVKSELVEEIHKKFKAKKG